MSVLSPRVLKLAQELREMFDLSFAGRHWDDLPPGEPERWLECANDLIRRMKQ